jgi:hypothetical protein
MYFLFIAKGLIIIGMLVAGTYVLLYGLGIDTPLIKYKGFEGHQIPAGVILLATAILVARFWKISVKKKNGETAFYEHTSRDNNEDTSTKSVETETEISFRRPTE